MTRAVRWWFVGALFAFGITAMGCGSDAGSGGPRTGAHLLALNGCQDVESALREAAIDEMNARLDQRLEQELEWLSWCGRGWGSPGGDYDSAAAEGGEGEAEGEGSGPGEYSGTNNQVAGVDEADFIKTDGERIYVATDQDLRILRSWPAPETHEIGRVVLEGTPKKLLIYGDRVLVYSSLVGEGGQEPDYYDWYYDSECTYGYDCVPTGDGHPTKVTVLDVSDPTDPTVVREIELSGSLLGARRVGATVYTVVTDPELTFSGIRYQPEDYYSYDCGWESEAELRNDYDALRRHNVEIIRNADLGDLLPSARDRILAGTSVAGERDLMSDCRGFYRSSRVDGSRFTTVLAVDMSVEDAAHRTTIISSPGVIYSSGEALYMSVPHDRSNGEGWYLGMDDLDQVSTVHKFVLRQDPASTAYRGSGAVKGRVLNQFSMDEHEGYLRIATTTGHVPMEGVHSTLSVLEDRGADMVVVGKVDDLAPSEDIRSVRFDEERGYVVTFKKTDPLFVFDLSNPYAPAVLGELKIPGFSTYMHRMGEDHLLAIGYDADDQGSFAWFSGVLLQIFDVSDPRAPFLSHREVIGTRGSSSEALTNHLAFTYFAPRDLLALPMTICEGGSGGGYGSDMTFSGLMVYDTTVEDGFHLRGRVDHPADSGATCSNWWTNASSEVKRSIIMDDYVFSVSKARLKVNHLDDLSTDLVQVPLVD